jgi:1-acyl-sn-glycerol-3-phosphate acyltransferase
MARAKDAAKAPLAFLTRLICGVNARWLSGPPTGERCIYFSNHTSHLDAIVLWATLPPDERARTRPVAAEEYWSRYWVRRALAKTLNAILVNRVRVTRENNPMSTLRAALEEGSSLIVFPEGTRSSDGDVHAFRSGLFHVARAMPALKLVPVYTENLTRILPKGEILPVPVMSSVTFGRPMRYEKGEGREAFLRRAREAVLELRNG